MKLAYIYTKEDIFSMLKQEKELLSGEVLTFEMIEKRMKIKPNHPNYYRAELELNDDFKILFQATNDEEFPEYTFMLFKNKHPIARVDFHDSHRRHCKKEKFKNRKYNELHIHLYCDECIKEKLKWDSFVLDLHRDFENFEDFCEMCCKITNIKHNFSQKRLL